MKVASRDDWRALIMRVNHWSCSRFADWLRGTQSFHGGTIREWDEWKSKAKDAHSFRFWLSETVLDNIQGFLYWPYDSCHRIKCYLKNRFVTKTHVLPTGLPKGRWYDCDTKLLHGVMGMVVQYVEGELAHMHRICVDTPLITDEQCGLAKLNDDISCEE